MQKNPCSEAEKLSAAYVLSDEIYSLHYELNIAEYMMQEITDEYFRKYSRDNEDDRLHLCWEFPRYAAYVEVVDGIVSRLTEIVEQLVDYKARYFQSIKDESGTSAGQGGNQDGL